MTLLHLIAAAALSQPAAAKPPQPGPAAPPDSPAAALGRRIAAVRAETQVAPVLVLVPHERAFLTVMNQWRAAPAKAIFPILLDTGTPDGREDIARFCRAFKPARIVRVKPGADADVPVTPAEAAGTLYTTFGAADENGYYQALSTRAAAPGPVGVVACQPGNPAGLALAAAYGQVLVYTQAPAARGADFGLPAADNLSRVITATLGNRKLAYEGLGDQIDAVTLCFDSPARVIVGPKDAPANPVAELTAKPGEALSLTDLVGRETTGNRSGRWAWASQITGDPAQATYRAMCAVFLQPSGAAAFNGYGRTGEFAKYNPTDALATLKAAGLAGTLIDRPTQSAEDWRQWASGSFATRALEGVPTPSGGALPADLYLINTMGNDDFFQLEPGICYAGDAPFPILPAAVQFNHSWSLRQANNPVTVGGRWLDRGAYVYVGSVHEPYLSAFVTPNDFARRLAQGWPLAAAARISAIDRPVNPFSAAWRVAVLGDALWSLRPAMRRTAEMPEIAGAADIAGGLPADLRARRYAEAFDTLCMLGRDADAARLARAALSDEPQKIDRAAARRALMIAYRAGEADTLTAAAQRLADLNAADAETAFDATAADAVWHAFYPRLPALTASQTNLLTKFVRPYSYAWDTATAATALKRAGTPEAARAFFDQQYQKAPDATARKRLDEARQGLFR